MLSTPYFNVHFSEGEGKMGGQMKNEFENGNGIYNIFLLLFSSLKEISEMGIGKVISPALCKKRDSR